MDRVNALVVLANRSVQAALSLDERRQREPALRAYILANDALQRAASAATAASFTAPQADRSRAADIATTMTSRALQVKARLADLAKVSVSQRNPSNLQPSGQPRITKAATAPTRASATSGTADVLDSALVATIESEILDSSPNVSFDDISGMEDAKAALHEMIVLPAKRPDLYTGLRSPSKGILLYGPPGTGKTLCAKAVASASNATFFSISASTLGSKFHGESEKLMKALFHVARQRQPAFIFIGMYRFSICFALRYTLNNIVNIIFVVMD